MPAAPGDDVLGGGGWGGETLARALPDTGAEAGALLVAGGALTGTGAALLAAARRLRSTATERTAAGTDPDTAGRLDS